MIPLKVNAHTHGGYSHDSNVGLVKSDWMSGLSDELTINQLSIPGTGNSMSYGKDFTDFTLTQSMDLETQLNSGIRFLELGVNNSEGNLRAHVNLTDLGVSLVDVIKRVSEFLKLHREEIVIIKIHSNSGEGGDLPYLVRQNIESSGLSDFIFDGSRNRNPKLGDARGRIIILADYSGSRWKEIPYREGASIQDNNYLSTNWDLYSKWERVKEHLEKTNRTRNSGLRSINYLTGSGGSFPYFVASGHVSSGTGDARLSTGLTTPGFNNSYPDFPRVNSLGAFSTIAFEGTNVLTLNYITREQVKFTGIVVADFPGNGLINEIIDLNFRENINNDNNNNSSTNNNTSTDGWGFTYRNIFSRPNQNNVNTNNNTTTNNNSYGYWSTN